MGIDISGLGASAAADIQRQASSSAPTQSGSAPVDDASVAVELSGSNTDSQIPSSVLDEIGAASQAYENLAAAGQHLHFGYSSETGEFQVELHDTEGNAIGRVDPSDVLNAAAGQTLTS